MFKCRHTHRKTDSQKQNETQEDRQMYIKTVEQRINSKCKLKCYVKPIKDPLGVSPSKENQGTTRGKEKIILPSVGIEPTTSGLDLPFCTLPTELRGRTKKVGDDLGGESRRRESKRTFECCAHSTMNTNGGTEN